MFKKKEILKFMNIKYRFAILRSTILDDVISLLNITCIPRCNTQIPKLWDVTSYFIIPYNFPWWGCGKQPFGENQIHIFLRPNKRDSTGQARRNLRYLHPKDFQKESIVWNLINNGTGCRERLSDSGTILCENFSKCIACPESWYGSLLPI